MTMSKELFLAILSMDSYNRGYNAGLGDGQNVINGIDSDGLGDAIGTTVGKAEISFKSSSDIDSDEYAAGFYAVAYTISGSENIPELNGKTVISYRGTDPSTAAHFVTDAINGYGVALGSSTGDQATLAAKFFQEVTNTQNSDPTTSNVTFTGHSLGGGLAGLMAAIYGQDAAIFDNMPFEDAAGDAHQRATNPNDPDDAGVNTRVLEDFYNNLAPWSPQIGANIDAYAVTGEFADALRVGLIQTTEEIYYDSHAGGSLGPFALHSQALMVSLMFAQHEEHFNWRSVGAHLWGAAFDNAI